VFSLDRGEEACADITFISDSSQVVVSDRWASDSTVAWNVKLFNQTAKSKGISLKYTPVLGGDTLTVCISGENSGEFHGVILLSEEAVGNSAAEYGVWIKLIVEGDGGNEVKTTEIATTDLEKENLEESSNVEENEVAVNAEEKNQKSITGSAIRLVGERNELAGILVIFSIIIIGYCVYRRKK